MSKVKKILLFSWNIVIMIACSLALFVINIIKGVLEGFQDLIQFFPNVKKMYIRFFKS